MRRHLFTTTIAAAVISMASVAAAAGPPFELSVKRDRLFGGSAGTLAFTAEGIEYRTNEAKDARRWTYDEVKQVQILSPTRIAVLTYEDQGRLRLGADRTFELTVTGEPVSTELVTFLLDRVDRPIVTAVMPQYGGEPLFRVRAKHQQQSRGSDGTLVLYDRQLLYVSEQEDASRYWRFQDVVSVLTLDRYRLQVTVYEGGSGNTRTFVFELKSDLPDGFYDALWARVNPPAPQQGRPVDTTLATSGRE